ncbi:MAG: hypothetical protein DRP73_03745 [Candidatus Omnitrophota bacterium]|nr:MAG: hypothetical protein DRP73_03745 [Candidatus Omnitrophota bacterium]
MNVLEDMRNKGYLKLLLLILGGVILVKFVLFPLGTDWRRLNIMIAGSKLQMDKALRLIACKERIDRIYSQLSARVDVEELFQPREVQKLSLYKEITTLADENKVRIKTVRPASGLEEGLYFDVEGEGSFLSVVKFLSQLENPYTQNYIQEVVLTPSTGKKILFRLKIKREFYEKD